MLHRSFLKADIDRSCSFFASPKAALRTNRPPMRHAPMTVCALEMKIALDWPRIVCHVVEIQLAEQGLCKFIGHVAIRHRVVEHLAITAGVNGALAI